MGIDFRYKHRKTTRRKKLVSQNPYMRLLYTLYKILARRTSSGFNKIVARRLLYTRKNRPPVSLQKVSKLVSGKPENTVVVSISNVTNDEREIVIPKLTLAALHVSEAARARIEKAGGKVLTLDQLALLRPTGAHTLLIEGSRNARKACRHFRGLHGKHAAPYIPFKAKTGRKHERNRGSL